MIKKTKSDFSHQMIKEIFEQPGVTKDILNAQLDFKKNLVKFSQANIKINKLRKIERILLIGCGSSYHAGLIGSYLLEKLTGIASKAELADEFNSRQIVINNKTLVIALSQSGATGETVKAVLLAKKNKAMVIGITNQAQSQLDRISDVVIYNQAGAEQAVAATKTFTSQLILLVLLALKIGRAKKMKPAINKRISNELKRLPQKIEKILRQNINIQILANKYYKVDNLLILGKKYQFPLASEAALKFKEATYLHAEGFATGEFRHGPIAMLDKAMPCLALAPVDSQYKVNKQMIKRLKAMKRKVIVVTTQGNRQLYRYADAAIYIPKTLEMLMPILTIVPLQLLAYHMAVLKGINPDKPRNLTKFIS